MNESRLLHLAHILDTVPKEQFDLAVWDCGTAACAIGHACRDPQFKAEGLHTKLWTVYRAPVYQGFEAWEAVYEFFGIEWADSKYLFVASGYPYPATPQDVASRIRSFVSTH